MNNVLDPRQPAETQLNWSGDAIHATAWVGVLRCTATGAGFWAVYYGDAIVENGNAVAGLVGTGAAETIAMERAKLAAERAVRAIALRLLREAGYDVKVAELLRAELAEVRATLDSEWGRGEGPRPGWVYHDAMWYRGEGSGIERRVTRHRWWLMRFVPGPFQILAEGRAESNRAAMIAVDAVPSPMDPPSTEDRVTEAEANHHNALWDMP